MSQPERTGSDFNFEWRWVANNYRARVQRAAVLYALTGIPRSVEEITDRTQRVVGMWRARITHLQNTGYDLNGGPKKLAYVRNCTPAFVKAWPDSIPCKMERLCPFCYARWVGTIWDKLDDSFDNPRPEAGDNYIPVNRRTRHAIPDRSMPDVTRNPETRHRGRPLRAIQINDGADEPVGFPYWLIEHQRNLNFPYEKHGTDLNFLRAIVEDVIGWRQKWFRKNDFVGGFCSNFLVAAKKGWQLRFRALYKVRPGFQFCVEPTGPRKTHRQPTRKIIFGAIHRVCRYPKYLMTGDAEQTVALLTALQGRRIGGKTRALRLTATYGDFRNSQLRDLQNEQ